MINLHLLPTFQKVQMMSHLIIASHKHIKKKKTIESTKKEIDVACLLFASCSLYTHIL